MTKRRRGVGALAGTLAAMLLAAGTASPVLAQSTAAPGPPSHEPGMRWGMGRPDGDLWLLIRAANLTAEQQASVRTILSAHRASRRPLIEQLRQTQQELSAKLLGPGQIQIADVEPQLQRLGQLRDQLAQDSAQTALEVRAVLTPDQLGRVAATRERMRQIREEMRQLMQSTRP